MRPYYEDAQVVVYHGDCREVLPALEPVETCITDPPYGLSFMGKGWDRGVPGVEFWEAIGRALLPGAPVLAFGGTRTFHRLTVAIEDAGFEIRDCLMWLYGSGFPKSLDVSKAIDRVNGERLVPIGARPMNDIRGGDYGGRGGKGGMSEVPYYSDVPVTAAAAAGYGTALKPAWEPIILARKLLAGTVAENVLQHGTGALNIDGCRVGFASDADKAAAAAAAAAAAQRTSHNGLQGTSTFARTGDVAESIAGYVERMDAGRWPANLILDEEAAAILDEQSGERAPGAFPARRTGIGYTKGGGGTNAGTAGPRRAMNQGGASRFFYTTKATALERETETGRNTHPTVKPIDLMAYLCRLTATPTGGTVLDPFAGSGSTLIAALRSNRKAIGIELLEEHCEIIVRRIQQENLDLFGAV